MRPLATIRLVATRELWERIRSRAFLVSSGFIALLVFGTTFFPAIGIDETTIHTVGVVEAAPTLTDALEAAAAELDAEVEVQTLAAGETDAALTEERVDAVLKQPEGQAVLRFAEEPNDELAFIVASALRSIALPQEAAELGLSPEQARALIEPPPLAIETVEPVAADATIAEELIGFAGTLLLFVTIVTYGQWVLAGVIEEKQNRVVEVLLASMRPYELLVGKVSGIVLLALGQLVITALAAAAALTLSDLDLDLSGIGVWEVANVALWFFLGVVLYSMLYGALGSLASRQEDAQSLALPAVIVLMVGYFIVVFALIGGDPDGPLARGVSLFPFTAPIAMPPRVALGDVPAWEFALSVLLTLGATAAVSFIGGRIYEAAILQTGPRIGFRQALRYIRR